MPKLDAVNEKLIDQNLEETFDNNLERGCKAMIIMTFVLIRRRSRFVSVIISCSETASRYNHSTSLRMEIERVMR